MRRIARASLLLGLGVLLLIEGLSWSRTCVTWIHFGAYPRFGMSRDGEVVFWDWSKPRLCVEYDAERRIVREWPPTPENVRDPRFLPRRAWLASRLRLERVAPGRGPRFLRREPPPPPGYHWLLGSLNTYEARRRLLRVPRGPTVFAFRPLPVAWSWVDGRIVCRDTKSGATLAGFGPDGYRKGAAGGKGARFGVLRRFLIRAPEEDKTLPPRTYLLLEKPDRLHFVEFGTGEPVGALPPDSREPLEVRYSRRALGAPSEILAAANGLGLLAVGDELVVMDATGRARSRSPRAAGERLLGEHAFRPLTGEDDDAWGLVTELPPFTPTGGRVRLRVFRDGAEALVRDVELEPRTGAEKRRVALLGGLSLLRPLPLSAISFLSPPPRSGAELSAWWWRDPLLAGGRASGWLLASLGVALLCAWRARASARRRCATAAAVRFWTAAAFLLGPLGLVWMRLVLPHVPIEGGRAVNLETEPWAEPARRGTELFA